MLLANATSNSTYSWGYKSVNRDPQQQANRVSSDLVSWYDDRPYLLADCHMRLQHADGTQPFDGW